MEKAFDKIWTNCLEIIKDIVEWQHFKTWFEPIRPVELKDKVLRQETQKQMYKQKKQELILSGELPGSSNEDEKEGFDDSKQVKVVGFKLHSKKHGVSKGLLIEDEDKNIYMLDEVLDLRRDVGSTVFDRKTFLRIYKEYLGHRA